MGAHPDQENRPSSWGMSTTHVGFGIAQGEGVVGADAPVREECCEPCSAVRARLEQADGILGISWGSSVAADGTGTGAGGQGCPLGGCDANSRRDLMKD